MSSFCGSINLQNTVNTLKTVNMINTVNMDNTVNVTHTQSVDVYNSFLNFEGFYGSMRFALLNITYTARDYCNRKQHDELIIIEINNLDNLSQMLSVNIPVVIVPVNRPPQIIREEFPSWTFRGIQLQRTLDFNSAAFEYFQLQSGPGSKGSSLSKNIEISSISSDFTISSGENVMSQLAVFRGEYDTYVLGFQYGNEVITLLSNSYIPMTSNSSIPIQISIGNSFASYLESKSSEFFCFLDGVSSPARLSRTETEKILTCNISYNAIISLQSLSKNNSVQGSVTRGERSMDQLILILFFRNILHNFIFL